MRGPSIIRLKKVTDYSRTTRTILYGDDLSRLQINMQIAFSIPKEMISLHWNIMMSNP